MHAPFERVLLVVGLRRGPNAYLNAADLVPLAPAPDGEAVVATALHSLESEGLIEIDRTKVRRVRFRRTEAGVLVAERLIRDGRVSFMRAVGGRRNGDERPSFEDGENLL
jgi:DNA-binding PadR family transcriptional regulator